MLTVRTAPPPLASAILLALSLACPQAHAAEAPGPTEPVQSTPLQSTPAQPVPTQPSPSPAPPRKTVDLSAKVTITAGQLDALLRAAASQGAAAAAKANADLDQCRSEAAMADVRRQLGVDR